MANRKCTSCGRRIRGRRMRWGNVFPLCRGCHSHHCRHMIRGDRLIRKVLRGMPPSRPQRSPAPRRRSLWERLFG